MSRAILACAVCCVLLMLVLVSGCGKAKEAADTARTVGQAAKFAADMQDGKATIKTEDGEVEIESDEGEGKMTIKTDDGEMQIEGTGDSEHVTMTMKDADGKETKSTTGADVDVSDIDLAVYPGAEQEIGHRTETLEGARLMLSLKTKDDFEKVAEFYEKKYPDARAHRMSNGDEHMLMLSVSDGPDVKSINVVKAEDEDTVQIHLTQQTSTGE